MCRRCSDYYTLATLLKDFLYFFRLCCKLLHILFHFFNSLSFSLSIFFLLFICFTLLHTPFLSLSPSLSLSLSIYLYLSLSLSSFFLFIFSNLYLSLSVYLSSYSFFFFHPLLFPLHLPNSFFILLSFSFFYVCQYFFSKK